jgi:hypothetical protein
MALVAVGGALLAAGLGFAAAGAFSPAHAIHAGLMIYAWGILLPVGSTIARYFKVTGDQDFPREIDNHFWWTWHRLFQTAGMVLATLGALVVHAAGTSGFASWHSRIGASVLLLGWLQVIAALLRGTMGGPTDATLRGDHYDMTRRRLVFEALHKTIGWITLGLAGAALVSGAVFTDAPDLVLVALGILIGAHLLAIFRFAHAGRWVDTYRAIWGHAAPAAHEP